MPKGLDYVINIKDGDFGGASKAKTEMQGLDAAVDHTHEKIGGLGSSLKEMGIMLAEVFAVEKVWEFGKESVKVFRETESAAAQVQQGIISTNGAAGRSIDELREKAEKFENTTLFSEAQTEAAEAIQLSFTNIRGKIYDEAIPAIQDMATRMAGGGPADLKGAALMVDKALQDPIRGIAQLHRVGVDFSTAQEKMITTAIKHGDVQKAQGLIIKELNTEFGGSAKAARDVLGPAGDLNQENEELKKSFGHVMDDGLRVIIPLMVDFVHGIRDAIKWMGDNKQLLIDTALVVGGAAAAYGIYELSILAVEAPMLLMTAAQWALNVAMDANPVGIIVVGIGALIGGLIAAYKHSETFRAILAGIGSVASELVPVFKGLGETILGALTFNPVLIVKGFADAYDGVQKVIADGGIGGAFNKGYDASITESKKDDDAQKAKDKATATGLIVQKPGKDKPYSINTGRGHGGGSDSTTMSGGRSVRNVQVTITKLVERIEVSPTTIQGMNKQDLKRFFTELLVGAVHDGELALGSQ